MNPFKRGARIGLESAPRAQKPEPTIRDGVATLRLYDPIDSWGGDWGVSAKEFAASLDQLPDDVTEIRLLINSPGGEVWDGMAILNQLRAHPARVVAVVEGIAASAASFIAAGCDECVMARNSELFIHNAWGMAVGDAEVMRDSAADLERLDRNLASIYSAKSGRPVDEWLAEMPRDRFYTADEAVAAGLADRIEGVGDAAAARARFDLSVFARSEGRHAATSDSNPQPGARSAAAMLPDSTEPGDTNQKELNMSDILKAGLRDRLGLTDADATDEAILAALDARTAEPAPAAAVISTLPEGAAAIDAAVLAQLQADAAAGREARAQQISAHRDAIVDAALADGRIAPVSRATWRAQLDIDEAGTAATLESFPKGAVVPTALIGHQVEPSDGSDKAGLYALAWGADDTQEG